MSVSDVWTARYNLSITDFSHPPPIRRRSARVKSDHDKRPMHGCGPVRYGLPYLEGSRPRWLHQRSPSAIFLCPIPSSKSSSSAPDVSYAASCMCISSRLNGPVQLMNTSVASLPLLGGSLVGTLPLSRTKPRSADERDGEVSAR